MCLKPTGNLFYSHVMCSEVHGSTQWCYDNYINPRSMKTAVEIRKQLLGYCSKLSMEEVVGDWDGGNSVEL